MSGCEWTRGDVATKKPMAHLIDACFVGDALGRSGHAEAHDDRGNDRSERALEVAGGAGPGLLVLELVRVLVDQGRRGQVVVAMGVRCARDGHSAPFAGGGGVDVRIRVCDRV